MPTQTSLRKPPAHVVALVVLLALVAPVHVAGIDRTSPYEVDVVLTAYYSPLPDQCCYVRGGYVADMELNGRGIAGADGTPVYPGMIAAPSSYAFGTRVALPGLGVFTVHDRGGAIVEKTDGTHRIDIWAGHGEEGLARALAFGVRRMRATVYPPGSDAPPEAFSLEQLAAPLAMLEPYRSPEGTDLLSVRVARNDRSLSVRHLQESLRTAGYFDRSPSGYFGEETEAALRRFIADFQIDQPGDRLTETTAAYLVAAVHRSDADMPIGGYVDAASSDTTVRAAQRLMRFLGYYRGRTDGVYDDDLFAAILRFQQEQRLVGTEEDAGAGRIGPLTMRAMERVWNQSLIRDRAERLLTVKRAENVLADRGERLQRFLATGEGGADVRALQELLAQLGFFPADAVNGHFGPQTEAAVLAYQKDRGIVASDAQRGAGYVGVATLASLRAEQRRAAYYTVRGNGWEAL